jgi:hypothetical protein
MTSDDLLMMDSVPMDRLSSCSLDSVIGYLDQLLGRNKEPVDAVDQVVIRSRSPSPTQIQSIGKEDESQRQAIRRKMLSSSSSSDPIRSNFTQQDEEAIQRVMDLSFASVYEMPSSSSSSSSTTSSSDSMMMPCRPVIGCQKVMTVLTESIDPPESLDSGVESNKSDDESQTNSSSSHGQTPPRIWASLGDKGRNYAIPLHQHDYQNLIGSPFQPQQQHQRRSAAARRVNQGLGSFNSRTSRTNRNRQDPLLSSNNKNASSAAAGKDDKFYEICLGHLCWQMEAGNSATGTGLGFDRWISIFSLQKHQDELIQLSGNSGSPSSPSSASPANHRKHSHHHQTQPPPPSQQQQQQQLHHQGNKRQGQRHHSTGGMSKDRQGSQENNNCKFIILHYFFVFFLFFF